MSTQSTQTRIRALVILDRVTVACIFLVAGFAKIKPLAGMPWSIASINLSLAKFAMGVDGFQILPPWAVTIVAHFLPFFELLLGVWLLSGVMLKFSSSAATLTICVFMIAMFAVYIRGVQTKCDCGFGDEPVGPASLTRDGVFLLMCLALALSAFLSRKPWKAANPAALVRQRAGVAPV
jgi:uncharacterized membrane protein YphA (DoxX/SURF4 family)